MPTKPLRPCRQPGCPALVKSGYCEAHKRRAKGSERPWRTSIGSASSRGYGSEWRALRVQVLQRDSWCRVCGVAPATHVDHVVPKARGGSDQMCNLQGLCQACHTNKTAQDSAQGRAINRARGPRR